MSRSGDSPRGKSFLLVPWNHRYNFLIRTIRINFVNSTNHNSTEVGLGKFYFTVLLRIKYAPKFNPQWEKSTPKSLTIYNADFITFSLIRKPPLRRVWCFLLRQTFFELVLDSLLLAFHKVHASRPLMPSLCIHSVSC